MSFVLDINIQCIACLGCYLPKNTLEALIAPSFLGCQVSCNGRKY